MAKLNGETITDEQIRKLLKTIPREGGANLSRIVECHLAIGSFRTVVTTEERKRLARARCAEIINARNEDKS